ESRMLVHWRYMCLACYGFFFQAEDGIRDRNVTGVQTCALPISGYKRILNTIYNHVLTQAGKSVLDIGFGTGTLTTKLYQQGCTICGQDFSHRMIELAQEKMPEAHLYQGDFTFGLAKELTEHQYDAIIATYSLHHLSDAQKVGFLSDLLDLLKPNGCIYIGDVAFHTRGELETCRRRMAEMWDEDEI